MVPVGKTLVGKQASTGPRPKPLPEAIVKGLNPCAAEICCLNRVNISCFSAVIAAKFEACFAKNYSNNKSITKNVSNY